MGTKKGQKRKTKSSRRAYVGLAKKRKPAKKKRKGKKRDSKGRYC